MVNEFLKFGGYQVRNKLLKIMNIVFEKGVLDDFRKGTIKILYKKGDKGECDNH